MKSAKFFINSIKYSVSLVLIIVAVSCNNSRVWDSNKTFNSKFSKQVQEISQSRVEPKNTTPETKLDFTSPVEQNSARYTNAVVATPEYYSSQQFYNQAVSPSGFRDPQEMFENSYAPTIGYPFRKIGGEFDEINVPSKDAYGIAVGMSDKEYLLVSRKLLQKNIDEINKERTSDDISNSEVLISEQSKIKRRIKTVKIFGPNSVTESDNKKLASEARKRRTAGKEFIVGGAAIGNNSPKMPAANPGQQTQNSAGTSIVSPNSNSSNRSSQQPPNSNPTSSTNH